MRRRMMTTLVLVLVAFALIVTPTAGAASPHDNGVWYTVCWGDTLSRISRQYGVTVSAIVAANGIADPNRIRPGQRLLIPTGNSSTPPPSSSGCDYQVYLVSRGDTLWSLSRRFGVTLWSILQANHIYNPNLIYAGQRLTIPRSSFAITSPASGAMLNGSVHVSGTAKGIFENQFGVEVRTAEGKVLARTTAFVNATEMAGTGPFAVDLTWTKPATTQPGRVVVFDESAMDGSIIDQNCVDVTIQGSGS